LAAKHDIERGITGDITATNEQLLEACRRAAEPISEHKRLEGLVEGGDGNMIVSLVVKPLMGSKPGQVSWVVAIGATGNNVKHVTAQIVRYKTLQSRVMGFIPAGPKTLGGRREFFMLLDALENELRALDPKGEIVRT
jgi:hypothetical protein